MADHKSNHAANQHDRAQFEADMVCSLYALQTQHGQHGHVGHDYRVHGCNGSILLNHKPQPFHSSLLDLLGALEPTLHNTFEGICLDYILSTACAVTNIHSLSLREQVIMIHDLFIMHLQKMRVDPIRRATLSHGRHCPSYPLTVLRSGVKHSKKWLLWHPDLRYHSLVFHVLESSKASCHSFRATAKRFAGVAKKLRKIPLHGWCVLQCKQLHFKTVWGSETWTLFGIWRPCQIQVVCASIQSSVWDENHPNTQSRERTQIHSGLHSLWKAIEYRTWTAENP